MWEFWEVTAANPVTNRIHPFASLLPAGLFDLARLRKRWQPSPERFYQVQRRPRNPNVGRDQIDPLLRRLRNVNRAASDIIEFLNALNDPSFDKTIPARVPSGLNPGGRIQ